MQQKPHLFIFGYGYTAKHIARIALQNGLRVSASSRKVKKITQQDGVTLYPFSADIPIDATAILSTVPPQAGQDPVLSCYRGAWPQSVLWFGYLSSTGVYGDTAGKPVNEKSPLLATSIRGQARIGAEKEWLNQNLPVHIFRLAGIYGPERNMLERVKTGNLSSLEKSNHPVNRIHVEDIAKAVLKSMTKPKKINTIYNLADDAPAPTADVIAYATKLLGVAITPSTSNSSSHLQDGSRIVLNDFIKKDLGFRLNYPNYKIGLDALFKTL